MTLIFLPAEGNESEGQYLAPTWINMDHVHTIEVTGKQIWLAFAFLNKVLPRESAQAAIIVRWLAEHENRRLAKDEKIDFDWSRRYDL